jgi:hypothetical protein
VNRECLFGFFVVSHSSECKATIAPSLGVQYTRQQASGVPRMLRSEMSGLQHEINEGHLQRGSLSPDEPELRCFSSWSR